MQAPPATLSTTNTTVTLQQPTTASQLPPDQTLQQPQQSTHQQIPVTQSQTQATQPQVTQNQTVTPQAAQANPSPLVPNLTINPNLYPTQTLSTTNSNKNDSLTQNTTQSVQQQPSNTGSNVKTSISNNSSNSVMNNMNNNNTNNSVSNSSNASTVPLPNPSPSSLAMMKNEGPVPLLLPHQLPPITSSHNVGMIPNMNSLMQSAASQLQQQLNAGQHLTNMINANAMKQSGGGSNQSAVSEIGLNPNFVDQIEMSLAQFENKNELMNNLSHSSLMHDISLLKQEQLSSLQTQQNIMNQMNSQNLHMHLSNNGFGMEMAAAMNGLAPGMGNLPMHLNPMVANSQMPMFDPFNPLGKPPNYNNNPNHNSNNANSHGGSGGGGHQSKKDEKYLGVRPLEDLMMNPNDKKMGNHGGHHDVNNKMGFGANNVKNANSWSSLASGSPQSTPKPKPPAMDTFQAFKKQAKEKEARLKLLEQQEIKRVQKEQAEKERQRQQEQIKAKQQQEQAEQALNNGR